MKKIENPPIANYLMGSMRYSFEDAVADVIDNSISARCHVVKVLFSNEPSNLYVGILDDGKGIFLSKRSDNTWGQFANQ